MKKIVLTEDLAAAMTAAEKARRDAVTVAVRCGYRPFRIPYARPGRQGFLTRLLRQTGYLLAYLRLAFVLRRGDILLLPHPFRQNALPRHATVRLLRKRGVRVIRLVHDLDSLRKGCTAAHAVKDDEILIAGSDIVIVHNEAMRRLLTERGAREEMLVTLGLFDYLTDASPAPCPPEKEKTVVIAGNLEEKKSGYVGALSALPVDFSLYGVNYTGPGGDRVTYHGAFAPDDLPAVLTGGFGLVWDGASLTACAGETGAYLRINAPHKLSLYLAAGLPVLIWREAAAAETVTQADAGLAVDSLADLPAVLAAVTPGRLEELRAHAAALGQVLRRGDRLTAALREAEARLG